VDEQLVDSGEAGCGILPAGVIVLEMGHGAHILHSRRVGLALSGGAVRGLAHIGVVKALEDCGIRPVAVAGTSAGSLIGAMLAAGLRSSEMARIARSVFWPALLNGDRLVDFCNAHLPAEFDGLDLPFAAVATDLDSREAVAITQGPLARALSASCAVRVVRRPVRHLGRRLKDGGIVCVLPTEACRDLGADFVIASDVWELSSMLRSVGVRHGDPRAGALYPRHFRAAAHSAQMLLQPAIPLRAYVPGPEAVDLLVAEGERATRAALAA
jgi:NTE family protein